MKNPRRTWKLTYDRLPRVNHDLGWSGNCKWEAALAKLTIGGDECNRYSYRSETDRRRWEPSCRLSHSDVEGKEKPPRYDLIAATKALWWNHLVLNFPEIEQSPQLDLRAGIASDRIIKQEVNRKDFNILSLLKIWHQRITTVANWMHYKSRVKLVNLRRDFWICEIGTGRQVAQLHDRYMMMMKLVISYNFTYTGCHRRNGSNFGRVFLMLNYTDITQNTYVPSWTVIEIMAK